MHVDRWTGWLAVLTMLVATTARADDAAHPPDVAPRLKRSGLMAVFTGKKVFARASDAPIVAHASLALRPVPILTAGGVPPRPDQPNALELASQELDLVVWARPADLATVVTTNVRLAPTAKAIAHELPADAPGVVLHAGAPVVVTQKRGDAAKVQILDADVEASGWIPVATLGTAYAPTYRPRELTDDTVLMSKARLLDKPRGTLLLTLRAGTEDMATQMALALNGVEGVRVQTMKLLERGVHTLVIVEGRNWTVTGWVANRQIDRTDSRTLSGFMSGNSCGPNRIDVPAGTSLLQATRGVPFGATKVPSTMFVREVVSEHAAVDLDTEIGRLRAWVAITGDARLRPETNCDR
jgi:hypothetical protein